MVVSGSQTYGGSPTFSGIGQLRRLRGTALRRHRQHQRAHLHHGGRLHADRPHAGAVGSYTLASTSCSGATLSGANAADYTVVYTSAANDFTVNPIPVNVAVSGTQTYGGIPELRGRRQPPLGHHREHVGAELHPGRRLDDPSARRWPPAATRWWPPRAAGRPSRAANAADYAVAYTSASNDFTVTPAPLTITASSADA